MLAAILLVVYLDRYRARVSGRNAPTPVLVAKRLIPNGTPGNVIATQGMYAPTTLPQKEVEVGAVADPSYLAGRAAAADIFPGQQLTETDFAASDTAAVDSQLTGTERAFAMSIDGTHGISSQVMPGDRVDVYISVNGTTKLFEPNVKVITTPTVPGPAGGGNLILQIDTKDAARWLFAADNSHADLRPSPGHRSQAHEALAGNFCDAAEVARPRGQQMPSRPVHALLAVEPGVDAEDVKDSLPGTEDFNVVGVVTGAEEALSWLRGGVADLLLVACAGYSDRALLLLDAVARQAPDLNVMVLGHGSPNGFLRRAFEAGADDIVMLPATPEQIRFEIHKLMARKQGADTPLVNENSRLVCILGPKGGTGKTLTSTNLSVSLAQKGEKVALIDLDLQFGDVALCLGLPPEKTVYDLAQSPGALDWDKLQAFMAHHSSGVHTLIAPRRPDQASAVGAELLREIYSILRQNYDWVIVDTPPGFTAEVITSIDHSTDIVMVGMLDSLSLKNTKLGLETLELMKYDTDHIYLLLNRAHSRVGISQSDVEAVLGRTPDVFIPSDREIPRTVNEGIPIVVARPQSEPAEAFGRLADMLRGESASVPEPAPALAASVAASESSSQPQRRRLFGRKG